MFRSHGLVEVLAEGPRPGDGCYITMDEQTTIRNMVRCCEDPACARPRLLSCRSIVVTVERLGKVPAAQSEKYLKQRQRCQQELTLTASS